MINKLFGILSGFFLSVFIICAVVIFTLNFRFLYYSEIDSLKISEYSKMSKDEIVENYDVLIDYLSPSYKAELSFPSLPMSYGGKIHFEDVKSIFVKMHYAMYASLLLFIVSLVYLLKKKNHKFLFWSSIFALLLPASLALPFSINFYSAFITFHKLFFNNNYWIFDPIKDPVINILPEQFFMHCAILILFLLTLFSVLSMVLYFTLKKMNKKRV